MLFLAVLLSILFISAVPGVVVDLVHDVLGVQNFRELFPDILPPESRIYSFISLTSLNLMRVDVLDGVLAVICLNFAVLKCPVLSNASPNPLVYEFHYPVDPGCHGPCKLAVVVAVINMFNPACPACPTDVLTPNFQFSGCIRSLALDKREFSFPVCPMCHIFAVELTVMLFNVTGRC